MKVLQINSVCGIGSTGRIATDIHNILLEEGHESYIAYGIDLPQNCDNTIKIGKKLDNYTHAAKTRMIDKHGFGSKRATKEFIKKVIDINPDIIHLHNIHGYYLNIEILFDYLKEANKPVVWTLHDCWSFTGHCTHFDYIGCNKWETGCFDCPQKKEYPKSILIDNSEWNYNKKKESFNGIKNLTIVTPSNWLADLARDSFLKNYEILTINNGIDLSIFKVTDSEFRSNYKIAGKFIILGVASIWTDRKGLDDYIKLAKKIEDEKVIVLVGLTEKQKRGLPQNIIGITKTDSIEMLVEIYNAADVFLNLTFEDTFPTVNIESLACGTPVITYNTGGSIESIDSTCGVVIEKDLESVLIEINKFSEHKFSKYDCKQRSKVFNKNIRYKDYINLYASILD